MRATTAKATAPSASATWSFLVVLAIWCSQLANLASASPRGGSSILIELKQDVFNQMSKFVIPGLKAGLPAIKFPAQRVPEVHGTVSHIAIEKTVDVKSAKLKLGRGHLDVIIDGLNLEGKFLQKKKINKKNTNSQLY